MTKNKILVIDSIEDILDDGGELAGKLVTDKGGNQVKVKKGQGGKLADRWDELLIGRAYSFTMGLYKDKYPYVQDFTEIKDIFKIEAAKAAIDKPDMRLIQQRELALIQNSSIQAQTALNRAVDLAVAKVTGETPPDIIDWIRDTAKEFYQLLQSLTQNSEVRITKVEGKSHKETKESKEPITGEARQSPEEDTGRGDSEAGIKAEGLTTDELLEWVATQMGWKSAKPARSWLVNKCRILEGTIDEDPEWVKNEVSQLQGWV